MKFGICSDINVKSQIIPYSWYNLTFMKHINDVTVYGRIMNLLILIFETYVFFGGGCYRMSL